MATFCAALLAAAQAAHLPQAGLLLTWQSMMSFQEYSFRSTASGHAQLMRDLLGTGPGKLPEDFWGLHMQHAGRSQASNSHKTYFTNYAGAFGSSHASSRF